MAGQEDRARDKEAKVRQYEAFLNETLRGDLRRCLEERDGVYQEQAEFLALRNSILAIRTAGLVPGEPLKTKVDLGCNFYCQARVADPAMVMVAVGLGFFLELTLEEALKFVARKEGELDRRAEELTRDGARLKARIKLVIGGLQELQQLGLEEARKPQRDICS